MIKKIKNLSPTSFENMVYDILTAFGLENAVWRTPGRDVGRDIEGIYFITDLSGHRHPQKWYIECKKYSQAVDWPTVREKLSYAESHDADFLLVVTTSTVSPQGIDEINRWNNQNRRPKVRVWGGYTIVPLLEQMPSIQIKYGLSKNPASQAAVSLLPLSTMTLKFTQAAYSEGIFLGNSFHMLEAAAALADLFTNRLKQLQQYGAWIMDGTRVEDIYSWLEIADGINISLIDRYFLRAIICVYKSMVKCINVRLLLKDNDIEISAEDNQRELMEAQRQDLREIALLSDCEISFEQNNVVIRVRESNETR